METTRDRVGALLELPARMEHGQGNLGGGLLLSRMHAGRDAAAIVDHRAAAVDVQGDLDRLAEPGHVFVDAVVHHLVHKMVQAIRAGTADVHRGTLPDRVQAFQNFDLVGVVRVAGRSGLGLFCRHRVSLFLR